MDAAECAQSSVCSLAIFSKKMGMQVDVNEDENTNGVAELEADWGLLMLLLLLLLA